MTDMTTFDLSQIDRLLTTTRAVRRRLDLTRPVERDVIFDCLRVALQAPTGGNRQGWRWLVIDDPDLRAGLADVYRRASTPYFETRTSEVAGGSALDHKVLSSAIYLADHLHEVPVHVVPCALERLPAQPSAEDAAGFYGSMLPAVWSFMLALRSRGLGSALTTLHLEYEREAAELLGIPETVTQIALIPVAYYTGTDFRPGARKPVEAVTYLNTWGHKVDHGA
jgi:nitroreductase